MSITKESKIAVLCGGKSAEREISLRSGKNCHEALLRKGYKNSLLVDIKDPGAIFNLKGNVDIALLTTHGKYGEDGCLQGFLEWLEISYIGSGVLASAIAMDKYTTKQIAKNIGIPTAKCALLTKENQTSLNLENTWKELSSKNSSVFLKPKNEGSSVDTYKINSLEGLKEKCNEVNLEKSDFLVEEYIKGKEVTVSILGKEVLPILELRPKNEFYDIEAKYTKGLTDFILPAEIDKSSEEIVKDYAKKVFFEVGCKDFGRVDFILDETSTPYLLEINTLPGMTDTSDLPAQAKCAGIKYDDLVEKLINLPFSS